MKVRKVSDIVIEALLVKVRKVSDIVIEALLVIEEHVLRLTCGHAPHIYTSLKSGNIPKAEGGQIHLNYMTVLRSP